MRKILIVGGVAGGATAAARLRRLNEEDHIVMFERGEYISFANCGLPYHIGEVIKERGALLVQTVEGMKKRFNLDIRNFNEVVSLNTDEKKVSVKNVKTGEIYEENYDVLILSPGAQPVKPPIGGLSESENVFTLRNIPDTDSIKGFVDEKKPKTAVVIGGGFIGVEMAENLVERGVKVKLVEMLNQVMTPFDFEMAQILHKHMESKGVELILGDGVDHFENSGRTIVLKSGLKVENDMVILSIGIRPDTAFIKDSKIEMNDRGFIKVDDKMQTNIKDVYAVGDAVETHDRIFNNPINVALASPANRQARIVADRINGIDSTYKGVLGTSVAKVFDLTAASTGFNEKRLKNMDIKYDTVLIHPLSNAGYYPTAKQLNLKLIFEVPTGKILGAQAIGESGVEKRIDVISTAIAGGLNVYDLQDIELSYAPPFSSAKDPVNMAGYAASNILDKMVESISINEVDSLIEKGIKVVDVRTEYEFNMGHMPNSINIPLDSIRDNLDKFDKNEKIYLTCQVGLRGYLASRILIQNGYKPVNISGGYKSYSQLEGFDAKKKSEELRKLSIACTDNTDIVE